MTSSHDPSDSLEPNTDKVRDEVQLLLQYLRKKGLVPRHHRRLVVGRGGASVSIIPVVNITEKAKSFHRNEGAISISSDGGVLASIATLDNRTKIARIQFFHIVKNRVIEGPKFTPDDMKPRDPGYVDPSPEQALID